MTRRRVVVAGLALLLVAAWLAWPAADPPSPEPAVEPRATRPPSRAPAPPPTEARPRSPEVAALERLAAATGRYVAACPGYDGPGTWTSDVPGRRYVPNGGGFVAMVDDPSGITEIRSSHERVVEPGVVEEVGPSEVLAVLHWRTDAEGRTTCVLEPPAPRDVRVRVLDTDGQPVEGAQVLVLTHPTVPGGFTGPDGWATIQLYADEGPSRPSTATRASRRGSTRRTGRPRWCSSARVAHRRSCSTACGGSARSRRSRRAPSWPPSSRTRPSSQTWPRSSPRGTPSWPAGGPDGAAKRRSRAPPRRGRRARGAERPRPAPAGPGSGAILRVTTSAGAGGRRARAYIAHRTGEFVHARRDVASDGRQAWTRPCSRARPLDERAVADGRAKMGTSRAHRPNLA